jgi:hypothetical protein
MKITNEKELKREVESKLGFEVPGNIFQTALERALNEEKAVSIMAGRNKSSNLASLLNSIASNIEFLQRRPGINMTVLK